MNLTAAHYLALDLGAESGRAIIGNSVDGKLTLTETLRCVIKDYERKELLNR